MLFCCCTVLDINTKWGFSKCDLCVCVICVRVINVIHVRAIYVRVIHVRDLCVCDLCLMCMFACSIQKRDVCTSFCL